MEVYALDRFRRRIHVIDKFESMIWSERMRAAGDFQLVTMSTLENRRLFVPGLQIGINLSKRIMVVETTEDSTDAEGRRLLKVTGTSIEGTLKHRYLIGVSGGGVWGKWVSEEANPKDVAMEMYQDIVYFADLEIPDVYPTGINSDYYPTDTIAPPSEEIIYESDIKDLLSALMDICNAYSMGFRITQSPTNQSLFFDVYMGSDRTTGQTTLPAVVFSPDMDNLKNVRRLFSNASHKTVAYVVNDTSHEIVYADGYDVNTDGLERRVLYVRVDNGMASSDMIQKGKDELAKHRMYSALDGEIPNSISYRYEVDYYLGDLVELRDEDGTVSNMQVVEQIFVQDKEGERSFPTLAENLFIYPGSWVAWDFAQEWDDLTTEEWDDLD